VIAVLREGAEQGLIDRPVWLRRRGEALPLRLRLVAVKKSPQAAKAAHRKARREAQKSLPRRRPGAGTKSHRRPWWRPIG
jgi:hypothetical protein